MTTSVGEIINPALHHSLNSPHLKQGPMHPHNLATTQNILGKCKNNKTLILPFQSSDLHAICAKHTNQPTNQPLVHSHGFHSTVIIQMKIQCPHSSLFNRVPPILVRFRRRRRSRYGLGVSEPYLYTYNSSSSSREGVWAIYSQCFPSHRR